MSHFFKYPVNYSYNHYAFDATVSPRIVDYGPNDNNYKTYSTSTNLIFQTYGTTIRDPSSITHVFIKCKGVDTYSVSVSPGRGTGTGLSGETIDSANIVNGIQHDLKAIGPLNASEVQLVVTGTNPQIYEFMCLDSLLEVDPEFTNIRPSLIKPGESIRQNIRGDTFKVGGLSDRRKRHTAFEVVFLPTSVVSPDTFLNAIDQGDNFTFAENIEEWPDRVYPAYLQGQVDEQYIGRVSFNEKWIRFNIVEA